MVEFLPNKNRALNSVSSSIREKQTNKRKQQTQFLKDQINYSPKLVSCNRRQMSLKLVDSVSLHESVLYKGVVELAGVGH